MKNKSIGFIGGGRITQIFLAALKRKNINPASIAVNEIDDVVASQLIEKFPDIKVEKEPDEVLRKDYIFISLHPPVFIQLMEKINSGLNAKSILISLAPKLTVSFISKNLNGFSRIVRMIPNAPSIINEGFNPVYFSSSVNGKEKDELVELLRILGEMPEVEENKLEAYALLTAMGPTYFWFQFYELKKLSLEFGLTSEEFEDALKKMITGSLDVMSCGMCCKDVNDLIPVKPLASFEGSITDNYDNSLRSIYNKIKAV